MARGVLGLPRPFGFTPIKALREDRQRTCDTKEGDLVRDFTFDLNFPRRADTMEVSVGDVAGPGGDVTQAFTVPTEIRLIGMARRPSKEVELGADETATIELDRALLARRGKVSVIPEERGFSSIEICVE